MNNIASMGVGLVAGIAICFGVAATVAPEPELPPCATEDSDNCYWDADTMGNNLGDDSVVITEPETEVPAVETVQPEAPATETPVETPVEPDPEWNGDAYAPPVSTDPTPDGPLLTWELDTLECGINAGVAVDRDANGNNWAYCEPTMK